MSAPSIRPETPADAAPIRTLLEAAFGRGEEADLVDRLRRDGDLVLSLVAEADALVGHIAFCRLELADGQGGASALAPLAVRPDRQGRGIGTALVRAGLARLRAAGETFVLVVGEPGYYGRFGFSAEAAQGFKTPYDGPYLMALPLADARLPGGTVRYPPAFAGL